MTLSFKTWRLMENGNGSVLWTLLKTDDEASRGIISSLEEAEVKRWSNGVWTMTTMTSRKLWLKVNDPSERETCTEVKVVLSGARTSLIVKQQHWKLMAHTWLPPNGTAHTCWKSSQGPTECHGFGKIGWVFMRASQTDEERVSSSLHCTYYVA